MDFINIIVGNENARKEDQDLIFGSITHKCNGCSLCRTEDVTIVPPNTTIFDLLVMLEAFSSKSQARKNWKHGNFIPPGFSEFFVGKLKRHLTIWNPTE